MTDNPFTHRRWTPPQILAVLAAGLVAVTVVGRLVFGDADNGAATVAWLIQMALLCACIVTVPIACWWTARRRLARRTVAR